ncbi:SRPBCC domain-containing protein [Candidatus Uhrbacteria bacterium]|nr:SRPBCC domain-containing protein [Candidatus Uhrbacteria bacterium]
MNTTDSSTREIVITRMINAPRTRVWETWTTADHLAKWWGPDGFTTTTHEFNFSVGGRWRFIMHGPDGTDYPNHIVFTQIKVPELIAHDHGGDDGKVHFRAVVTFEEKDNGTLVTLRSVFPSAQDRDRVVKDHDAIEGGKQTLGRLAEYAETK